MTTKTLDMKSDLLYFGDKILLCKSFKISNSQIAVWFLLRQVFVKQSSTCYVKVLIQIWCFILMSY